MVAKNNITMARRWNPYSTSDNEAQPNDLSGKMGEKSPDVLSEKLGHFSTFRVDPEVTGSTPNRDTPESRVSWSRSPSAHYQPPNRQTTSSSQNSYHLPYPEPGWKPVPSPSPYQESRYSTPLQLMYPDHSPYYTPGYPDVYSTPSRGNMLPPPPPQSNRARSVIYYSVEGRGQHTQASSATPDIEGFVPSRRQRADTGIPRGEIGKRLSPREDLILIETCNENAFSYGLKDKVTEWWKKIEKDFQAVVNRPIPYKSVRRRMESLVEQRKKEIADYQTGDERKEDNWTHAIDAWIETMEVYNLEQENSLRENTVGNTKRAISTMKRANMLEIHSKRKGIEHF